MISKLKKELFSCDEINSGRQIEIDLARAVIIFCLPLIHCMIECTSDEGLTRGIPYLFDTIIGGPLSAPMYMFVMGVGMVYTRSREPKHHLFRGLKILLTGYVLNICRFLIPYLIGYAISGEYDKYIEPLVYKVLGNDILIFAGIAMMLIAVFIKLKISNWGMIFAGIALSVTGTLLTGVDVKTPFGNIFLGYLIGTEDAAGMVISDFSVCNWLIFPICGYVFGTILKKVKNKKSFYTVVSMPCLIIAVVYFAWGIASGSGMFGEGQNCYYHMNTIDAFASLAMTVGLIGAYYFISKILSQKILKVCKKISRNITYIYCIHWVLISFSVNLLIYQIRGTQELSQWWSLLLGCTIGVVSIVIAHYYRLWKEGFRKYEKVS